MVGRPATRAKQSPPSPTYVNSPLIVAETTTTRTEVVTTTTTTHFFSFPLWRKRSPVPSRHDVHSGVDEHGVVSSSARSSFYMFEKDLPPTPDESILPSSRLGSTSNDKSRHTPTKHRRLADIHSPPSTQPTAALAHASLGVGLSHILPNTSPSPSSSSTELNTITFAKSVPHSSPSSRPRLHKSKSAQKLRAVISSDPAVTGIATGNDERRRSRGISFTSSTLLNIGKNDLKGGNHERKEFTGRPTSPSSHSTPKSLARRASFWSRRKLNPHDSADLSSSHEQHPMPQTSVLPIPPPISPFNVNITISPSSPPSGLMPRNTHSRGLSRSHSARSSLRPALSQEEDAPFTQRSNPSAPVAFDSESNITRDNETNPPTPRRRLRSQTNPPLLHRLSLGWLPSSSSSSSSSPTSSFSRPSIQSPAFPRPHTSSSILGSPSKGRYSISTTESPSSRSSRLSLERGTPVVVPLPAGSEEPLDYLNRLQAAVNKAEIAGILASSSDPFYKQALETHIGNFDFVDDPLDVALRKLLMEVGLPRETQQIDRVIEAFANRYLQCNPALFTSNDHPYILAFSLIMLHTDAFNKSNKRKMSKADYIKNTRLPGIFPEVLDCFYDNIVFAPFIFIEDPLDINGQRGVSQQGSNLSLTSGINNLASPVSPIRRTTKVDPYYLITNNLLGPLRIDVETLVPKENPYSYEGTSGPWDEARLQQSFANANQVEVSAAADTGRAPPFFGIMAGNGFAGSAGNIGMTAPSTASSPPGDIWTLKLTKVGLLNRKDDVLEGGRKASNRKWKQWSVLLTGSQLLFFRDPSWATSLISVSPDGRSHFPQASLFRPDELLSVRGAIAVYDKSYTRYDHTLRFLLSDGRQILLQAPDEKELNEWIAGINYASAFKTAGVRIRPLEMSGTDVKLTGVAAATSHLHDLQAHSTKSHVWNGDAPQDLMGMLSNDPEVAVHRPTLRRNFTIVTSTDDMDLEVPTAPEIDGAEQFKATFDQVKADLAAGLSMSVDHGAFLTPSINTGFHSSPSSVILPRRETTPLPSRSSIIQSKVDDLQLRITTTQSQLDANMRFVRNIAALTPFQKSTRDRLMVAVQNVAQRVTQARLEITRLICHRDVLINDLASEGRSWNRAKAIALQAATETLQSRHEIVPRMTLSHPASDPIDIPLTAEGPLFSHHFGPSRRSISSICESFHSALDFGPDWPMSEDASSSFLGTSRLFDSPPPSTPPSITSHSSRGGNSGLLEQNSNLSPNMIQYHAGSPPTDGEFSEHEKFYTAPEEPHEEAEDWNNTRCAQRVSLVRLPSDIQFKSRFSPQRHISARNART